MSLWVYLRSTYETAPSLYRNVVLNQKKCEKDALDGSSVEFSKMAPIFTPKYKNGHTMYTLFTLGTHSTQMHVFFSNV